MPATEQEFSYEKNIAPYASKFFRDVSSSRSVPFDTKMFVQSQILKGTEDIENQRRILQKEREAGIGRRLDNERQIGVLEDARAERARREQAMSQREGVKSQFAEVIDGAGTSEEKRQRLAQIGMQHADTLEADPVMKSMYGLAASSLPKDDDKMTAGQTAMYLSQLEGHVPPDQMSTIIRDPNILGPILGRIAKHESDNKQAAELRERQDKDADKIKLDYATKPLKWKTKDATGQVDASVLDKKGKPMWLDDESTNEAARIIKVLGTPEEQEHFNDLLSAPSDRERAKLVELAQTRYQLERIHGRRQLSPDEAKINPNARSARSRSKTGLPD